MEFAAEYDGFVVRRIALIDQGEEIERVGEYRVHRFGVP
jgi:hypothetical protein